VEGLDEEEVRGVLDALPADRCGFQHAIPMLKTAIKIGWLAQSDPHVALETARAVPLEQREFSYTWKWQGLIHSGEWAWACRTALFGSIKRDPCDALRAWRDVMTWPLDGPWDEFLTTLFARWAKDDVDEAFASIRKEGSGADFDLSAAIVGILKGIPAEGLARAFSFIDERIEAEALEVTFHERELFISAAFDNLLAATKKIPEEVLSNIFGRLVDWSPGGLAAITAQPKIFALVSEKLLQSFIQNLSTKSPASFLRVLPVIASFVGERYPGVASAFEERVSDRIIDALRARQNWTK
jgi:hypothetical protein